MHSQQLDALHILINPIKVTPLKRFSLFSTARALSHICLGHRATYSKLAAITTLFASSLLLHGAIDGITPLAHSASHPLPLTELNIHDTIYLPTVSSQRVINFTLPRAWQASAGGSSLKLHFQHSNQLLPNRSFLEVILNDKQIKRIPLTKNNAETTTLQIPLSGATLKAKNQLKFRVEQHYTHKCEDPVDASLWTQILPETSLHIQYFAKPIKPNIAAFPYPLVDTKAPFASKVLFNPPKQLDDHTLKALTTIQTRLGSEAHAEELHTHVSYNTPNPAEKKAQQSHWIILGTPDSNPAIQTYAKAFKSAGLEGSIWQDENDKALSDGAGLIKMVPKPGNKSQALLLVTANSSKGLATAADYLAHDGIRELKDGAEIIVPENWASTSFNAQPKQPLRYIDSKSKSLSDLGYGDQFVEKLYAPPITYSLPIVSDFAKGNASLDFDFTYSYGGGLNPRYSSLEFILNDRSIANIPLQNVAGEDNAHARIHLPTELLSVHNRLVAQFHMMPDKYGFCVDNYKDQAWGKIFSSSKLVVKGSPQSRLPNVGILNSTGFPLTQTRQLDNTHWVLANPTPTETELASYLSVAGRIGRTLETRQGYKLSASVSVKDLTQNAHTLIVGSKSIFNGLSTQALPLAWDKNGAKIVQTKLGSTFSDEPDTALIEQGTAGNYAFTLIAAENDAAFNGVQTLFEHDKSFEKLSLGDVQQVNQHGKLVQRIPSLADGKTRLQKVKTSAPSFLNDPWWQWLNPIVNVLKPITDFIGNAWAWLFGLPILSQLAGLTHWVLELIRGAINWFVRLPILSTIIDTVFAWIDPVLSFGPLAAITSWFKSKTILGFIAGNMVFWTLWGWVTSIFNALFGKKKHRN